MKLFLITLVILLIAFAGIGIKVLIKKNGRFSGTCASQNPHLNPEGKPCSYCGKTIEEQRLHCKNFNKNHPEEQTK